MLEKYWRAEVDQFAGHSAGPWKVFRHEGEAWCEIHAPEYGDNGIATVWGLGGPAANEANARLIAAAPDLLRERVALRAEVARLKIAAADALGGWRYIRNVHGDLGGVGWDRVEAQLAAVLDGYDFVAALSARAAEGTGS